MNFLRGIAAIAKFMAIGYFSIIGITLLMIMLNTMMLGAVE